MMEFKNLGMLLSDPRTAVLILLLIVAAVIDYRSYRIPNWLTLSGVVFGLGCNALFPAWPHAAFLWALGGLTLGLVFTLPMYLLKAMGAGDVKLMAMVGAFLGVPDTFFAIVFSFAAGGVAALGFALFHRAFGRMVNNIKDIAQTVALSALGGNMPDARMAASQSVGRMPFGVSIGVGTICFLVAKKLGYI